MTFSRRFGYVDREEIFEDAPVSMRHYYRSTILTSVLYGYDNNSMQAPLFASNIILDLYNIIGMVPDIDLNDRVARNEAITHLVDNCEWYKFYDIVELVGRRLLQIKYDTKHFTQYMTRTNDMLNDNNIGWRLDNNSELQKNTAELFKINEDQITENLSHKYEPAKIHYRKAIDFIRKPPLDAENSIKEIVSAVESIVRTNYPASTLGEGIKQMRRAGIPPLLASVMEKYYAFANAEPGIRHGGRTTSNIALDEAEFCLHVGSAIIRYLLSETGEWKDILPS